MGPEHLVFSPLMMCKIDDVVLNSVKYKNSTMPWQIGIIRLINYAYDVSTESIID